MEAEERKKAAASASRSRVATEGKRVSAIAVSESI